MNNSTKINNLDDKKINIGNGVIISLNYRNDLNFPIKMRGIEIVLKKNYSIR